MKKQLSSITTQVVTILALISCSVQAAETQGITVERDRLDRPIPMGVSLGPTPTSPFTFTGTAGMAVFPFSVPSLRLILSNNHVIGAAGTLCPNSSPQFAWVLQPGTLDIGFDPGNAPFYAAGAVAGWVPIDFSPGASNVVDAALAFTTPELAGNDILNIGPPTAGYVAATPGMAVKKNGRTTGFTQGTVSATNVTVTVNYGSCGTARFVGQTSITPGTFSDGGDSGSAILESSSNIPVALLFAGSSSTTFGNPILWVYLSLGVFVDGVAPATSALRQAEELQLNADVRAAMEIQARREDEIMEIPGVVGIGIGKTEDGSEPAFVVFCEEMTPEVGSSVPHELEGIPVRVVESGPVKAL